MGKKYFLILSLLVAIPYLNAQNVDEICCKNASYEEKITDIETATSNISGTSVLDLSMQDPKITVVPEIISNLVNLKCLDLSFNRVSTFHPSFVNLQKLECLDLSGNHYLQKLPAFFNDMPNLKVIKLQGLNWSADRQEKTKQQFPNINIIF